MTTTQKRLQYISAADAQAYLDKVQRDAIRLDVAIDQSKVSQRDPQWVAQWKGWLIGWRAYHLTTSGRTFWNAPSVYNECEARHLELQRWYEQAAGRGVEVGVMPVSPKDETAAGSERLIMLGLLVGGALVVVLASREGRAWIGR